MEQLQKKINYNFKNISLLEEALTHSSRANELRHEKIRCNERLEFLGDSVLSVIVSEYLYKAYPKEPEGELTKMRALLVCEKSLYEFAKKIDLGSHIILSKGERNTGGTQRPSILSDAFEALIAAVFLDGGLGVAREFVLNFITDTKNMQKKNIFNDYKTNLQEIVQKNPGEHIEYVLTGETGPDHDKHFLVEVHLNSNIIGKGGGRSKKEAEQQAAREALKLMGY